MAEKLVYVTGFGEFSGVKENPTTSIVQEMESQNRTDEFKIEGVSFVFHVLETSVDYCKKFVDNLDMKDKEHIFIHLGVDSSCTAIKLEECAYNNMNFRVPDEAGFQPQSAVICEDCEQDHVLGSGIGLPAVCQGVNDHRNDVTCGSIPVTLSTDPGRFLCNYIYYNTLNLQNKHGRPLHSVFIHVPKFETIPQEQQVATVKQLIHIIVDRCRQGAC